MDLIHGYIREYVLTQEFYDQFQVEKDSNGTAIWALAYYTLRCGLKKDLIHFLSSYNQDIQDLNIFKNKLIGSTMLDPQNRGFQGNSNSQVFKHYLSVLLRDCEEEQVTLDTSFWSLIWLNMKKITFEKDIQTKRRLYLQFTEKMKKSHLLDVESNTFTNNEKIQLYFFSFMFEELLECVLQDPQN